MLERILDYITVKMFGKYTLTGFGDEKVNPVDRPKDKYILDSVFLDNETAQSQLSVMPRNQVV